MILPGTLFSQPNSDSQVATAGPPQTNALTLRGVKDAAPMLYFRMRMPSWIGMVVLAPMLAACRPASPPVPTLIYGRGGDAQTLDPIHTDVGESIKVIANVFDTLVTYGDTSLEIKPSLAERWECNQAGTEWTFFLRPDVTFHDGTACDADAVAFSFRRLFQEQPEHVYDVARPYQPNFKVIQSIEVLDPQTVRFVLHEPSAVFLSNLAMFCTGIVSPTAVKSQQAGFGSRPVGTGPFQFTHWRRDQEILLESYAEHWRGAAAVSRVIFLPVAEPSTRVAQLRRGEIHIADNLPPAELDALGSDGNITIQSQAGINVGYLTIQNEKPPLHDVRVRLAIAHAIDKRELIRVAYAGHAEPAVNMVPPSLWGHHDELADHAFDPDKSRSLLAAAAQDLQFHLPLKLQLFVMDRPRPYMQLPLETAAFLRDSLQAVGVEIEIVQSDLNVHFERIMAGEHQLGLSGWSSDNADPDNFLYSLLDPDNISQAGNNTARYRNEQVHQLLLQAQTELDREARATLYRKVQALVREDVPVVPLVHTTVRIAVRNEVKDYRLHPSAMVFLRSARLEPPQP